MRLGHLVRLAMIAALCLVGLYGVGQASELSRPEGATAKPVKFEGRRINLSKGWGEARACVIWEQANASECFRTEAEMDQHVAEVTAAIASNPTIMASCSSYLRLYEHTGFGGRVLQFADRGYWQNLGNWGFNDELSSYKVGACGVHLAEHSNGGGYWYPGDTSPFTQSSCMCAGSTNWNDRVSSIYIK